MNGLHTSERDELGNIGFRMGLVRDLPLKKSLKTLADAGYKSVGICSAHADFNNKKLSPAKLSKLKEQIDELDLRICSVCHCCKNVDPEAALDESRKGIELASELKCNLMILRTAPVEMDPQGRQTTHNIAELIQAAEEVHVKVAIEPEPGTVIHGLYEFSVLTSQLAGLPISLNLNIGNIALNEGNVIAVIQEWARFIEIVHLCDVRRPDQNHLLPGDGHLDIPDIVISLRKHHYKGDLVIDLDETAEAPDQLAVEAMQRCKQMFS
ncbi:hypothetical protein CEE37_12605 [candidate division LCP-89 bacterium B3_LCP]|uniref:Xylose isomerase-like TIM barrel domain-containing protein n=1 Tax=candidate division LCP-89 bacterium B3_LCP TaxID=2012998 RepID=A0A532UTT2_UNCL8|nr:MAG: hypothetical protein CEE37_12605 [candidate division LCP-89 bacterium B3_LCP]